MSRKGSPNRNKQGLLARLKREFPNYHPVVELARIANDPDVDLITRKDCHKEVAKYVTPQLKAVDITSKGEGVVFNFSITQQSPSSNLVDMGSAKVVREVVNAIEDSSNGDDE